MFVLLAGVLGLAAFAQLVAASPDSVDSTNGSTPVIDLGYAQYQGTFESDTNTSYFLGIRYAQAPVGESHVIYGHLRWRAPQTPTATTGVQPATEQPNECYQSALNGQSSTNPYRTATLQKRAGVTQDEDCLFLNVYTPGELQPNASLPVVVWIHGGGYISGAASDFTGQDLIKESDYGVVVVIIQYRLGVFGFLPGSEVKANGVLNAGLLDQHFALQWVQEHIATFGGDPTKVTIWGESAGAGSVLQHIVANGGKTDPPLFRAAMTSSTFLPFQYHYNDTIPETLFRETVNQTNCSNASDKLECLRSANATTLQTANVNINEAGFYGTFVFVPVVDGSFIVERPTVTLQRKDFNGEMLLSVTNSLEGYVFVDTSSPPTNLTAYVTELFPLLNETTVQSIVQTYADDQALSTTLSQIVAVMGECEYLPIFVCPTYLLLQAFGNRAYKGEFAIPPGYHGQDVQYYFPTYVSPPSNALPPAYNNSEFITSFSQSFLSVVRSLNPNDKFIPDLTPAWSIWANDATEMQFNVTASGDPVIETITTDPALLERCA
ncbi:alpha/beta-hydrolase [Rhodofomes roseus]|uniref:Carboxylic ester hydrolase n=1 Tax=Rhodofomes roseus TaxID=34475 RepID=A0ABQ8K885_9APHY|nr:alpha/beta-hydrolase [Rhodofomes roseus]KAH9833434.1 alpha/beta-hydrolase [Rhodofomes roseus]